MNPSFDIIIPVYNGEHTIAGCIESVLAQSYENYSIRVVDNGSTDKTKEIVARYDIDCINKKERGRSQARNAGAFVSTSDYLVFIDCDVLLSPSWLEEVVSYLALNHCQLVATKIIPSGKEDNLLNRYRYFFSLVKTKGTFISLQKFFGVLPVVNSAAFAIDRSVFFSLGGFDEKIQRHEDLEFSLRAFYSGFLIGACSQAEAKVFFTSSTFSYCMRAVKSKYCARYADPPYGKVFFYLLKESFRSTRFDMTLMVLLLEVFNLVGYLGNLFRRHLRGDYKKSYSHLIKRKARKAIFSFVREKKLWTLRPDLFVVYIDERPHVFDLQIKEKLIGAPAINTLKHLQKRRRDGDPSLLSSEEVFCEYSFS